MNAWRFKLIFSFALMLKDEFHQVFQKLIQTIARIKNNNLILHLHQTE